MASTSGPFVSRGGQKLDAALEAFELTVRGLFCADLGAHVGGFTDCLLKHGASRVYSLDTSYGVLAWSLRKDERVVAVERENGLHFDPLSLDGFTPCDLVTIDLGWTRQRHAIPAALRWLKDGREGRIIALIKPQYEAAPSARKSGVLDEDTARRVCTRVLDTMPDLGVRVLNHLRSPLRGGQSRKRVGNVEYLALLARR